MKNRSTPTTALLLVALLAVALTAYAATRLNGLQIGPNPSTTNIDLQADGDIIATGTVTANAFAGDGSGLTGVTGDALSPEFIGALDPATPVAGDLLVGVDATDGALKQFDIDDLPSGSGGITALTGDVTASGPGSVAATIAAGAVDIAHLSATGTADGTTYLRGDNTWAAPEGSGTVTSVAVSGSDGIEVDSGSPITASGTIALGVNASSLRSHLNVADGAEANAVDSVNGQTGTVSLDADDIDDTATDHKFVASGDITKLGNLSGTNTGDVSLSGTPDYITISGQTITRNAVDLAADVTGALPVANGGTGSTSAADARTALGVDAARTDNSTNVTLAGTPDYITLAGQVITRGLVDLATDVSGDLPFSNVAQIAQATVLGRAVGAGTGDVTALSFAQQRAIPEAASAVTSSSNSVAWNSDNAVRFTHTLTQNTTIAASGGTLRDGQIVEFYVQQAAGNYTLSFNSQFAAGAGVPFAGAIPTVTTTSGRVSVYRFQYRSTNSKLWLCAHREDN